MNPLDWAMTSDFIQAQVVDFHEKRINKLSSTKLNDILSKNPYLFRAKNLLTASELIQSMLDARLSSSEEKMFGDLLERVVIFVAQQTLNGQKSSTKGIDLDFVKDGSRYLISIKSGPKWGNSSQYQSLRTNFKNAVKVIRQAETGVHIQPVLGICYGKAQNADAGDYIKLVGQSFWDFISDTPSLYLDIIEPISYEAKSYNETLTEIRSALENRLVKEFTNDYCDDDGRIEWEKLVSFTSKNIKNR